MKNVGYMVDICSVIVFGRKMKIKALQAPVAGTAPIIGAARSAGHDCGCVPEENYLKCRILDGIPDGNQVVTPRLGPLTALLAVVR